MQALTDSRAGGGHVERPARTVARGLGWFSIAVGLAECAMPRSISRAVGLEGKENLVRACGLREILSGVGILVSRDPEPWIWGRVAGDALDLGALSAGVRRDNPHLAGNLVAMLAVAQVTALDYACATALADIRNDAAAHQIDYSGRSGFHQSAEAMRGAALADFEAPRDFRIPEALRPWRHDSSYVPEARAS